MLVEVGHSGAGPRRADASLIASLHRVLRLISLEEGIHIEFLAKQFHLNANRLEKHITKRGVKNSTACCIRVAWH